MFFNFSFHNRTFGSSVTSQILDLKTLPIFSPLKISVNSGRPKLTIVHDCRHLLVMMEEIKLDYTQQPTGTSLSAAILDSDRRQGKVEEGNFSKQGQVITVIRVLVSLFRYYMILQ